MTVRIIEIALAVGEATSPPPARFASRGRIGITNDGKSVLRDTEG